MTAHQLHREREPCKRRCGRAIHARLSRTFSALAEIVYEEEFGFDVERVMLNYEPRTWFRISVGRFHTPVGYWNTALGGIRFDPIPSAAIKVEGGWEKISGLEGVTARGQVSWLF